MKKQAPAVNGQFQIPLDFDVDGVETKHATEMVISNDGHNTTFSFFTVDAPCVFGTPEQTAAKLSRIKSVKAKCVARVMIATSKLAAFGQQVKQQRQPSLPMLTIK